MKLPNRESAIVDVTKLRDYCLNPDHRAGRHKARVFAAVLGLGPADAGWLRSVLLIGARDGDARPGLIDAYGRRYEIDVDVRRGSRAGTVRTGWIITPDSEIPRLTSCYVLLK